MPERNQESGTRALFGTELDSCPAVARRVPQVPAQPHGDDRAGDQPDGRCDEQIELDRRVLRNQRFVPGRVAGSMFEGFDDLGHGRVGSGDQQFRDGDHHEGTENLRDRDRRRSRMLNPVAQRFDDERQCGGDGESGRKGGKGEMALLP
jgi:hypothetical protein